MAGSKTYAEIVSLAREYVERHGTEISERLFVLKAYAPLQAGGRRYAEGQCFCADSIEYAVLDGQDAPCSLLYAFGYDADEGELFPMEDCTKHAG